VNSKLGSVVRLIPVSILAKLDPGTQTFNKFKMVINPYPQEHYPADIGRCAITISESLSVKKHPWDPKIPR
jgi:hypothetical protein